MIVFFKENRLKIVKLNENEDMTSPGAGEILSERHLEGSRLSSAMRGERERRGNEEEQRQKSRQVDQEQILRASSQESTRLKWQTFIGKRN